MKLLCLSNGHGEDAIALRILQHLQQHSTRPELAALPLVGRGHPFTDNGIPLVGPVKAMPSGGFVRMDARHLAGDVKGGLLQLTLKQLGAVRTWARQGGRILAVGDIVPLLFAWWSGAPYAFVGTAKSEYYLRDEQGVLPDLDWAERLALATGSYYYPWERWLMSRPRCRAVFPRDTLTADTLRSLSVTAFDLGNPMMDGLEPQGLFSNNGPTDRPLAIALIPGSRPPEAYQNWARILEAVSDIVLLFPQPLLFLAAIAPTLAPDDLQPALQFHGWQPSHGSYTLKNATLHLTPAFADCLHRGDVAIATAGTATEQFVGLGKPALILPGNGPQFTPSFARAQTHLLGPSVTLVQHPSQVAAALQSLLQDPDRLHLIAENGHRRMGRAGAAGRIAEEVLRCL